MKIPLLQSGQTSVNGYETLRNNAEQASSCGTEDHLCARGTDSGSYPAPIVVGAIFGVVAFILLAGLFWVLACRRKEARCLDLRSRPFPLDVKFGRSGPQQIHRTLSEPAHPPLLNSISYSISPPRPSRQPREPPPPAPRLNMAILQTSKEEIRRTERSSIYKSPREARWHAPLPPISQGYGVGLMTRDVSRFG
ncbi:hypothetical protein B0H11DRAFT_2082861, partial [Mycena galericulata]